MTGKKGEYTNRAKRATFIEYRVCFQVNRFGDTTAHLLRVKSEKGIRQAAETHCGIWDFVKVLTIAAPDGRIIPPMECVTPIDTRTFEQQANDAERARNARA